MNDFHPVRVKLFLLSEQSVGYIHFLEEESSIMIESELSSANSESSTELVRLQLRDVTGHSIQNDSILMLEFPDDSYAISFKEEGSDVIHRIYKHLNMQHLDKLMPKMRNLDNIVFELVKNPKTIVTLATSMPEYLLALKILFDEIEEEESEDSRLHLSEMFGIVKRLINEPDEELILAMISDDILPLTLGALEYNPATSGRRNLRKQIEDLKFVNLIDFPDDVVKNFIVPNMRLHFLRECVVATFIEPISELKFSSICQRNNTEVLTLMSEEPGYFTKLIERFYDDVGVSVGFLEELCNALKTVTKFGVKVMVGFQLMKVNIYSVLHMCMEEVHPRGSQGGSIIVEKILDIMATLTLIDNDFLEQYIIENHHSCETTKQKKSLDRNGQTENSQTPPYHFLTYLVEIFATDSASSKVNVVALMTNFLNPEISTKMKGLQLMNIIEQKFLKAAALKIIGGQGSVHLNESLRLFCDFLSAIYPWCPSRTRRVVIQTRLLHHLNSKLADKKVLLATIRLLKVLVESKDIHTYRYLMSNNLFKELEIAYRNNKHKSNLVESAFRNFFDCVTYDMPKKLIGYLNTTFQMVLVVEDRPTLYEIESLRDIR